MEKIWLKRYAPGVPAEIDPDAYRSIVDVFEQSCRDFADRPAYANLGRIIDFAELDRLSRNFAAYLQQRLGLEKGERVAIMMPNLLQYPIALFGILRAGLVVVNVNPLYTARELKHQLEDSGAEAIVILANSAAVLQKVLPNIPLRHVIITEVGDLLGFPKSWLVNFAVKRVKKLVPAYNLPDAVRFNTALAEGARESLQPVELEGGDLAFLQYTGGTTGVAKGAMLTHRNIVANLEQVAAWFASQAEPGKEIIITALPLYHVYSLTCNCLAYLKFGSLNVLITDPRDMPGFVAELRKWKFTAITGVDTLYNGLVNTPGFAELDFSSLKMASSGGMAVRKSTAERWEKVTGEHILEGYGLTETSPVATTNPSDLEHYSGSIGLPMPSTDISLRNDEGVEVPIGEPGELCIKGPQVMLGYWQREEATRETMTEDGYLKTGDIATVDEQGFFRIVDRKKDMILVSGFNVFPNEIEDLVMQCPGVLEAACVGVPDEKSNEAVKVFVVKKPGAELTAKDVRAFCKENMTGYKVPRHVEFREELPKSPVGKILRRELR